MLLKIDGLNTFYGDFQALFDIDSEIDEGEIVAVIGANGAGKSTLLGSINGLSTKKFGRIVFSGTEITGAGADVISRLGVATVPEGRKLFPSLTVAENLLMGNAVRRPGPWTIDRVFELFPALVELRNRNATKISGGQQQMVAIGRALLANPKLLLCDEISLGLSPKVVGDIYQCFEVIKSAGTSVLLVEQDVMRACSAADRFYCLLGGKVSLSGSPDAFDKERISRAYFGA